MTSAALPPPWPFETVDRLAEAYAQVDPSTHAERWPLASLLTIFGGAFVLVTALGFQHGFKLPPCQLCYWQRYGYIAAMAIAWTSLLPLPTSARVGLATVAGLALLATAGIAVYHAGVEWKWWPGPRGCSATSGFGLSIEELKRRILGTPVVRCDAIAWQWLGLSMAGWNAIVAAVLGVVSLGLTWRVTPRLL